MQSAVGAFRVNTQRSRSWRARWHIMPDVALLLLLPLETVVAQNTIPFETGVVLNYVMHNLDEPADRQFYSTITSVTPDETVFTEDMHYSGPDGRRVTAMYHRHQSRRELLGARTIDHGTTCNPGDTVDARYRGSTLRMASKRLLRQLKTTSEAEVRSFYTIGCSPGFTVSGTLRRVEPGLVPISILLNGERLDLQTIHARGTLRSFEISIDMDYWFLDDPERAWMIRAEGKSGKKSYLQQLGTVLAPNSSAAERMEQALERTCRALVYGIYFETASAELNAASTPTLQQIAGVLQQHPDWTLTIEGHTDSIGGIKSNLDLSKRRATAVRDELVRRYQVASARLTTKGFGLSRPVETNATIEGRARNRRVELTRSCS